ncbi:hypothetical protein PQJ75_26350 [Rhodoplanes sp. TEM]|uniref:Uncharacterized protein n=1 Tax=Rhodoplanes tepidamans TaxID=200616 RepID=A0ABT5J6Q3_RHOTP|nr:MULTISPECIES: hypothetical protein [Rhodoplanes]MDC7785305.1 hypothetical protein [Rhodoplanes tepidamans]MDC7987270.1 hypothetical protein [Rhodoplanes sp. TEM]MDQ0353563.1 hypothetical protein [Rhodoplanes tepidamans]
MFSLFNKTGIATVLFALLLIVATYVIAARTMSAPDSPPGAPASAPAAGRDGT